MKQGRGRPSASFLRAVSQEAALQASTAQLAGKVCFTAHALQQSTVLTVNQLGNLEALTVAWVACTLLHTMAADAAQSRCLGMGRLPNRADYQ